MKWKRNYKEEIPEDVAPKKEQTIEFVADRQGEFKMMRTASSMDSMSSTFIVK